MLDEVDRQVVAALNFEGGGVTIYPKPPAGHFVYFVGGEDGPIKIGFTQQPIKARLVCIQNGSPIKLHVLALEPAVRQKERVYHRLFAPLRLHGEWFRRQPVLLQQIDCINGVPGASPVTGCPYEVEQMKDIR